MREASLLPFGIPIMVNNVARDKRIPCRHNIQACNGNMCLPFLKKWYLTFDSLL